MHTPGPWNIELMGSEGWTVFANRLSMPHLRILATNLSKDDACLIAAAPQLLEALQDATALIKALDEDYDLRPTYQRARAAIQKAEA